MAEEGKSGSIEEVVNEIQIEVGDAAQSLHAVNYAMREVLNELPNMACDEEGNATEQENVLYGVQSIIDGLCKKLDAASDALGELRITAYGVTA